MSEQKRGKKRPKSYYIKCAAGGKRQKKSNVISAGMKGFLVTCNKYERETVREVYNLLNEYADIMYGPEQNCGEEKTAEDSGSESEEEDMEKAMAKETSAIKQASTNERRFQNTSTKCNNVIFVRTTVKDPCRLAHTIFQDIYDKQVQKVRYAIRMLPVEAICNPGNNDIETTLTSVLAPHFETEFREGIKYTAACKIRNNNSISKSRILTTLGKIIKEMNPLHQLCHDEPDLVIIVEIVQKACCFSVVKDYFKFKKYNLHEIVKKPLMDETEKGNTKEEEDDIMVNADTGSVVNVDSTDVVNADTSTVVNIDSTDVVNVDTTDVVNADKSTVVNVDLVSADTSTVVNVDATDVVNVDTTEVVNEGSKKINEDSEKDTGNVTENEASETVDSVQNDEVKTDGIEIVEK